MNKIPKIKLGKIARFQQGLQVDVNFQFFCKEKNYVQFLRIVDYTNSDEVPRYIENNINAQSYVSKDDVVMIRYGSQTAGKVVIGKEGIIANNMFRIIPIIDEIENRYLYYFLSNQAIYNFLMNGQSSSTMPAITFGMMNDIDIYLPSIKDQQRIASVLSTLDAKIKLNNKINVELQQMAKTLYDYWFVQFDFTDENGKPYKSSGGKMIWSEEFKKDIPEDWEVKNLLKNPLTKIIKPGIDSFLGTKNYLATADINEQIVESGNLITFENRESRANMQPTNNSAWFAKMKASRKHFYIGEYGEDFIKNNILSTGFMGLKCKINAFEYIASYLESDIFELTKDTISHGATMQGIGNDDLKFIKLIIPKEDILNKYKETIGSIYKKLYLNFVENQKLAELRDWLLPMLMNGQITVNQH